jgi:segregation and condensation protein B
MDETEIKHVIEAALLAAGRPLTLDRLAEIFSAKGAEPDRVLLKRVLEALANDYASRGIELKEVATGYRIQVKRSMSDWLQPLWDERAPRYTRALLETLALIAYRQPITRGEIEEVRGVVVSTNIMRTLLERSWVRVVGHRDVPGKPAMFGTTKEFLDYFGLKKLEDLPPLAELKDGFPELSPQTDLVESLEAATRGVEAIDVDEQAEHTDEAVVAAAPGSVADVSDTGAAPGEDAAYAAAEDTDDSELAGPDLLVDDDTEPARRNDTQGSAADVAEDDDVALEAGADVILLRAAPRSSDGGE